MNPASVYTGLIVLLQSTFWKPLKSVIPSFIQGLTKDEMNSIFTDKVRPNWKAVCLDGSSFDTTQNSKVM